MPTPTIAPFRVLSRRAAEAIGEVSSWGADHPWGAFAAALTPLGVTPSAGQLAALAALQDALDAGSSSVALEAAMSALPPRLYVVLRRLSAGWALDIAPARAAILLHAMGENPALESLRPMLGLPLSDPLLKEACAALAAGVDIPPHAGSLGEQLRAVAAESPRAEVRIQALRACDLRAEETRPRLGGPGPVEPPGPPPEPAPAPSFSSDQPWMAELVLIAKHTHVWLDQLSAQTGASVTTLDAIPDSALDALAERGINGLWLIGLWERSPASRRIKALRGDPDSAASAYALYDLEIAADLGGWPALRALRRRAWQRGIRLAADIVPNHTGLDSRLVVEHPEWFVQLSAPPYPGYTFDGPDLSGDPRLEIRIEDGYWASTDAAVVFQRVDASTGEARYLYHGNDGTHLPWNDTAQLDFLQPAVREAVIAQILAVAEEFPIIRLDAAMTLARQHVRRLWHPAPGDGGAVPSRSTHGVDEETFDAAMPGEFWREVMAAMRARAPDTLLLAEAFWMMEGTFVQHFGLHRVYNSAFMHMLRDGDNAGFRRLLREMDARVLERFANFMSNPDEATAAEQFGTGERYFGVTTLLATLPGLPLLGHGQVEGFTEKYGMEFLRPRVREVPDAQTVARHAREIAPLLRQRGRYARADTFEVLDLIGEDGAVCEDVIAFSTGDDAVIFNNSPRAVCGRMAGRSWELTPWACEVVSTAPALAER